MPPIARLSLHAAVKLIHGDCLARLTEEYPDQQIELRAVPFSAPPGQYLCWLDGKPFGEPINLEDVVGLALRTSRDEAVRSVVDALSERLMLHLQTAA